MPDSRTARPPGPGRGCGTALALLPFRWELIDAFHYLADFAGRREATLGAPDLLPPGVLRAGAIAALRAAVGDGGFLALLFHPFLADTAERLEAMSAVLAEVRGLIGAGAVRSAPMRELAAGLREQPGVNSGALVLDES